MELIFALKSNSKLSSFTTIRPENLDNVPRVFDELSGAHDGIVGLIEQYDELSLSPHWKTSSPVPADRHRPSPCRKSPSLPDICWEAEHFRRSQNLVAN